MCGAFKVQFNERRREGAIMHSWRNSAVLAFAAVPGEHAG